MTSEKVSDLWAPPCSEPEGVQAEVGVVYSRTRNLGDFNSVRVEVSVKMPMNLSEVAVGSHKALQWAQAQVDAELASVPTLPGKGSFSF